MNANRTIAYCCPRCKGSLRQSAWAYNCDPCGATFPIIAGIPDFRVYPDPYIDLDADRDKARYLAEQAKRLNFAELVAHYYAITPEVTPAQARRFTAHHLAGQARGTAVLGRLRLYGLRGDPDEWLLDAGCGTGGLLAAAPSTAVVGVDIALRWLVIGARRLTDLRRDNLHLVCACADYLPFRDGLFGTVIAETLVEHVADQIGLFRELGRVGRQGAVTMARTVNRLAPAPEPHVGLWGVGFLPRSLMPPYVRWRRKLAYDHIHLRSAPELRRILREAGRTDLRVRWSLLQPTDYAHLAPTQQQLLAHYTRLALQVPTLRPILTLFGPYLDIVSRPNRSCA